MASTVKKWWWPFNIIIGETCCCSMGKAFLRYDVPLAQSLVVFMLNDVMQRKKGFITKYRWEKSSFYHARNHSFIGWNFSNEERKEKKTCRRKSLSGHFFSRKKRTSTVLRLDSPIHLKRYTHKLVLCVCKGIKKTPENILRSLFLFFRGRGKCPSPYGVFLSFFFPLRILLILMKKVLLWKYL